MDLNFYLLYQQTCLLADDLFLNNNYIAITNVLNTSKHIQPQIYMFILLISISPAFNMSNFEFLQTTINGKNDPISNLKIVLSISRNSFNELREMIKRYFQRIIIKFNCRLQLSPCAG